VLQLPDITPFHNLIPGPAVAAKLHALLHPNCPKTLQRKTDHLLHLSPSFLALLLLFAALFHG
jgi:hypothetical protein